jgi:outer membrane receptor for ferrienterochelin and colicin
VTWSKAPWSSTVYVNRYGRSPNYLATVYGYGTPGAGNLSTWTLCNVSVRYQWMSVQLSLAVDNIFDTMPPADHSYPGYTNVPYNNFNYNVYGRSYFLEANYKFGK